jgi:hypothetical protein
VTEPLHDTYGAADDLRRSIEFAYQHIRERVARGGPGWRGWPHSIVRDCELRDCLDGLDHAGRVLTALENGDPPEGLGIRSARLAIGTAVRILTDYRLASHREHETGQ